MLVSVKSPALAPAKPMLEMSSVALPGLLSVTDCAALVPPNGVGGKVSAVDDSCSIGCAPGPHFCTNTGI